MSVLFRAQGHQGKWCHLQISHPNSISPNDAQTAQCIRSISFWSAYHKNLFWYVSLHVYPILYSSQAPGRGLALPVGVPIPEVIQRALESAILSRNSTSNRESFQRRRYWWLPYVVLEFDKNEILIDALGGDLANPVWNYRANL